MPGGRRNPLGMGNLIEKIEDKFHSAKDSAHDKRSALAQKMNEHGLKVPFVDLKIKFIGASGLPKMDVVGLCDPYIVASLDDELSFVSSVQQNTLTPVWNEIWLVKNVPATAGLVISVMDKDEGSLTDDLIGTVKVGVSAGAKEAAIEGPRLSLRSERGTLWLKIDSAPAADADPTAYPYDFAGPVRFSRHFSPTVGALTNLNTARLYSTWKMYLVGVSRAFGDQYQHWNTKYKAAQSIFQGPTSIAVRSGIQAGHRLLYARTAANGLGIIEDGTSTLALLQTGGGPGAPASATATTDALAKRVKPAVYTYVIAAEDGALRFSETGAAFFVDFASKHALHANCAQTVRYSGEFHPRPEGGWAAFNDATPDSAVTWEIVFDNNSGTYAPDKTLLPSLRDLLAANFPGVTIVALDREDEELVSSREACRAYALKYRGVKQEELQPHARPGEETLSHRVLGMLTPGTS